MDTKPTSINQLPDEVLLNIFSFIGPEDLWLVVPEVCQRWNLLAKDLQLCKNLSYICDSSSDISRIAEVRCGRIQNLKEKFTNWTCYHPEVKQVALGLVCVMPSGC